MPVRVRAHHRVHPRRYPGSGDKYDRDGKHTGPLEGPVEPAFAPTDRGGGDGESDLPTDASPELAEWLSFAREEADHLDPIPDTLDRLLGDPHTYSANAVPHAVTAN